MLETSHQTNFGETFPSENCYQKARLHRNTEQSVSSTDLCIPLLYWNYYTYVKNDSVYLNSFQNSSTYFCLTVKSTLRAVCQLLKWNERCIAFLLPMTKVAWSCHANTLSEIMSEQSKLMPPTILDYTVLLKCVLRRCLCKRLMTLDIFHLPLWAIIAWDTDYSQNPDGAILNGQRPW